jgi:predicted Zn-dependent protease
VLAVHHHKGDVLDEDAMRAMALHEIGHLLGLDHTYDVRSIMAPKVRVRSLSSADKATVRLLYTLPPGAVR